MKTIEDIDDMPDVNPTKDLMKGIRAALIIRGKSFSSYCAENGYVRQNAAAAICGTWKGLKSENLVSEILNDLGVQK